MTITKIDSTGELAEGVAERRGYQEWTQKLPNGPVKTTVSKLFTNEDNAQVHKILGILCLCSFLYRYVWVYSTTGTLGFDGGWFDHVTIALHLLLSTSSLIFHVIRRRLVNRPMIIWEEYRLHAIIFSTRCFSVYVLGALRPFAGTMFERVLMPLIVLAHHLGADKITAKYGSKEGVTTVRVKDAYSPSLTVVLRFYAFYQFAALASHLQPNPRLMDLGFNTFIAIQSSAFLMTLYRKGLITEAAHAFWYTTCLLFSLWHIFLNCGDGLFIAKLIGAYYLRTELKMNKYILWLTFALFSIPAVLELMNEQMVEITGDTLSNHTAEQLQWACSQHDLLNRICMTAM